MSKICTKCKITKPFNEFGQSNPTKKDGHNSWCLQCYRDASKRYRETAVGIYSHIKGRCRFNETHEGHTRHAKPFNLVKEEFIEWYENQPRVCHYCGLPESFIPLITEDSQITKVKRLTIDCGDNDKGYVMGNMFLACNRCNLMKCEYFTYQDWVEIGEKYIKPKWKSFLSK